MPEQQEMRAVYSATLMEMAEKDERIVAVQADLTGAHGMKAFAAKFPDRSFNVGVAEANMAGIAAGLAATGKIPFIHSFATFVTRRCFDQITISICYAGVKNVRIVGSDPGVSAELNGGTHMALEDVGIMRTLPGMTIFEPVDTVQLRAALPVLAYREGPVYIRLLRRKAAPVFPTDYQFKPDKADVLRDGGDVTIIATGVCVSEALAAAGRLDASGIQARVLNIHTVKPIDTEAIIQAATETGAIVTAENHNIIGGLGSAVAEVLAEERPTPLLRIGVRDRHGEVGKQDYLMRTFGITAADIENAVQGVIRRKA